MTSSTTTTTTAATTTDDNVSERHLRKRLAARVRQQRCRARKREAKIAKASQQNAKAARPGVVHQVVRGPVLIRSPARMGMTLLHHPTSPFIMYPRRSSNANVNPFRPSTPGNVWHSHHQPVPRSPPMTAMPYSRPLHQEIMVGSAIALGMTQMSPPSRQVLTQPKLHIPRVSPVAEHKVVYVKEHKVAPMIPVLDRLERKEETAIDAMLSLCRA